MRENIDITNKKRNLDTFVNDELQKKYEEKCKELDIKPTVLERPKNYSVLADVLKGQR